MLQALDFVLTSIHLIIIIFNLSGWIWKRTRRLHLYVVLLTAFSWLGLGIWFGIGYCPITDWQWRVKEKLGEQNLPNSFIKYFIDRISGQNMNPSLIDTLTAVCFILVAILSFYVNFRHHKPK